MRQAEPAANQPAARKDILNFLGRGTGGHVEILGNLAQQQISNAAAYDKSLKTGFLQFAHNMGRVRAKVS